MRKRCKVVIFLFLLLTFFRGAAQNVDSALNILATKFPQEKLYIHYDKPFYISGETMWFKAYLYSNGAPSGLSNNFYLEMIDAAGHIILQKKFPVMGAVAKGNIQIPDTISSGNCMIRAATPTMLNDDPSLIYKKNIFIFKPGGQAINEPAQNISLHFFPESGYLVGKLNCVSGFKATDQWGLPVAISGNIVTGDGTIITPFNSYHDGIGKIEFKPEAGKKYFAEASINGTKKTFALPDVQASGINMKVLDEKGGKLFQLARTEIGKEEFEPVVLVVEMNNTIIYENEIAFEGYPSVQGHLLTDSLPSGILYFTLFNKQQVPIAERLAFVNNKEYLTAASINITKSAMEKRAENTFELSFPDALQTSCSVAITDGSGTSTDDRENIYTRLLLTSDLKGYVYNPSWYFTNEDSSLQAIDNLLLTQGWSRFSWKKILAGDFPSAQFTDAPQLSLMGYVNDADDKTLVKGGKLNIYLQSEDSATQNVDADVDPSGKFALSSISFLGKSNLYYVYTDVNGKQKPVKVHIIPGEMEKAMAMSGIITPDNNGGTHFPSMPANAEINRRYDEIKTGLDEVKELERVVLKSKSGKKPIDAVNEKYTTGVFRTMGKVNIDNINEPANDRSMNAVDFIKNRVQQLEIDGNTFVNRKNFSLMTGKRWTVEVFLNEAPAQLSILRTIRADEIAMVKFYEAGFIGSGSGAPGGAVAVYTKEFIQETPSIERFEYVTCNGYSITKEFYQPDYKTNPGKKDFVDNRTTLYWNPDVYTDPSSKSFRVIFFNNDFSKRLRVEVEGFDVSGKFIHLEKMVGN